MSLKRSFIALSTSLLLGTTACRKEQSLTIENPKSGKTEINCNNSNVERAIKIAREATKEGYIQENTTYGGYNKGQSQLVTNLKNLGVQRISVDTRIKPQEAEVFLDLRKDKESPEINLKTICPIKS
jgi:hypothetical protein